MEIKSRYAGKCAKCGRELREGWNVAYDKDTKKIYCMPCSKGINAGETAETAVAMLKIPSRFLDTCSQCGNVIDVGEEHYYQPDKNEVYCLSCGELVKEMSSPDKKFYDGIRLLINSLELVVSEVAGQAKLNGELTLKLGEVMTAVAKRIETIEANITVITAKQARDVAPKKTEEK